jgi:hypothetical protein
MRFSDFSLFQILIFSAFVLIAAIEIGRWFGVRAKPDGIGSVPTLEASVLGLLALMIGFTFAVALSRFEARREGVLNEANAIGTTALRARLLPALHSRDCLKLLHEYVQVRLNLTQKIPSPLDLKAVLDRSNAIQEALWLQAKEVAAKNNGMVPTGLFIQSLNEMIDGHEKRVIALISGVPDIVLAVLYLIAIVAGAYSGYAAGVEAQRARGPMYIAMGLFIAVILMIQDLDRPTAGFITASQQPMQDVADSIAGFSE